MQIITASLLNADGGYANWTEKQAAYIQKIRSSSPEALLIVASDKMHNMQSYFGALNSIDSDLIKDQFGGNVEDYFIYYGDIQNILRSVIPDHPATSDYFEILDSYTNKK